MRRGPYFIRGVGELPFQGPCAHWPFRGSWFNTVGFRMGVFVALATLSLGWFGLWVCALLLGYEIVVQVSATPCAGPTAMVAPTVPAVGTSKPQMSWWIPIVAILVLGLVLMCSSMMFANGIGTVEHSSQ